jgi:putative inorganic carbon (hco3(-)) transporter
VNPASRKPVTGTIGPTSSRVATIPFVGLAIFTFFAVSQRWPFAEVGIIVALLGLALRTRDLGFPAPVWWSVAFLVWGLLTSFFAMSPELARETLIERLKSMIIFFAVMNALQTEKQLRLYLLLVLGAFMIYPARGALLNYVHGDTLFGRAIWNKTYANPNDLAALALLTMGAALAIVTRKSERMSVRWGVASCAVGLLTVVLLTQSRGAFLGLVIGFGPRLLARVMKRPSLVVYVLIAGGIAATLVPDTVWHRLAGISKLTSTETVAQADPEGSAAERLEVQKTAWRVFVDHPVLGVGLGCYPQANAMYSPVLGYLDTHNTYLNLAAELGVPGLLLWLALVASVLRHVRRCRRRTAAETLSVRTVWIERAIIGYLVAGLFASYSGLTMFYLILGALWCAATLAGSVRTAAAAERAATTGKL